MPTPGSVERQPWEFPLPGFAFGEDARRLLEGESCQYSSPDQSRSGGGPQHPAPVVAAREHSLPAPRTAFSRDQTPPS